VSLIAVQPGSKVSQPRFLNLDVKKYNQDIRKLMGRTGGALSLNKEEEHGSEQLLTALDIVTIALDMKMKTDDLVELLKIMRNEIKFKSLPDADTLLNYKQLFKLFV